MPSSFGSKSKINSKSSALPYYNAGFSNFGYTPSRVGGTSGGTMSMNSLSRSYAGNSKTNAGSTNTSIVLRAPRFQSSGVLIVETPQNPIVMNNEPMMTEVVPTTPAPAPIAVQPAVTLVRVNPNQSVVNQDQEIALATKTVEAEQSNSTVVTNPRTIALEAAEAAASRQNSVLQFNDPKLQANQAARFQALEASQFQQPKDQNVSQIQQAFENNSNNNTNTSAASRVGGRGSSKKIKSRPNKKPSMAKPQAQAQAQEGCIVC